MAVSGAIASVQTFAFDIQQTESLTDSSHSKTYHLCGPLVTADLKSKCTSPKWIQPNQRTVHWVNLFYFILQIYTNTVILKH